MSRSRKRRHGGNNGFLKTVIVVALIIFSILGIKNILSGPVPSTEIDSGDYDAVCFVAGNVANSPSPNFSSAKKTIEDVFNSTEQGEKPNICMYSATANPYAIEIDKKFISEKGQNQSAINSQIKKLIRGVNEAATSSPSEGGANYFEAILRTASFLEGTGAENPLIIVYGSGLSDTGTVNFAFDNLLSKDNDYITEKLKVSNVRKDGYSNISLVWLGAGQSLVTNEQSMLFETWKNKVQDIYTSALGYVGITPDYKSINISDGATSVRTDFSVNPTMIPEELKPGYKLSLNESIARFKPDMAELYNYDEVKEALTEFAKSFNATPNIRVKITGYQTVCAKSQELSINRANTIRNVLVNELHVNASRIVVDGVAGPQDNREEIPRCGTTGIATEHRTVIIEVLEG